MVSAVEGAEGIRWEVNAEHDERLWKACVRKSQGKTKKESETNREKQVQIVRKGVGGLSGFTLKRLSSKLITLLPPLSPSSINLRAFRSVSYSISPSVHLYLFISLSTTTS